MTTQYFSQISNDYLKSKNKLEVRAKWFARKMSNRIGHHTGVEDFGKYLTEGIHKLNTEFPRCKPLVIYRDSTIGLQEHTWYVDGVFTMSLLPVNESKYPQP